MTTKLPPIYETPSEYVPAGARFNGATDEEVDASGWDIDETWSYADYSKRMHRRKVDGRVVIGLAL